MIAVPIKDSEEHAIGVVQIINIAPESDAHSSYDSGCHPELRGSNREGTDTDGGDGEGDDDDTDKEDDDGDVDGNADRPKHSSIHEKPPLARPQEEEETAWLEGIRRPQKGKKTKRRAKARSLGQGGAPGQGKKRRARDRGEQPGGARREHSILNDREIEIVEAFTKYCAGAIRQTLLYHEHQNAHAQSQIMIEAQGLIYNSDLDVNATISNAMQMFRKLISADRCTIFLYDQRSGQLWTNASLADELEGRIEIGTRAGLAGACFTSGEIIRVDDAYDDPRFEQKVDEQTGYRTRAVLCVPVCRHDGVIVGVAEMINKLGDGRFSRQDEELCVSFARHIAYAVHSAQVHFEAVKAQRKTKSLLEVTTLISQELNTEMLVSSVMELSRRLLQADRCTVFMHDKATNELWSKVASDSHQVRSLSLSFVVPPSFFGFGFGVAPFFVASHPLSPSPPPVL